MRNSKNNKINRKLTAFFLVSYVMGGLMNMSMPGNP
jgi:hypothetical protein